MSLLSVVYKLFIKVTVSRIGDSHNSQPPTGQVGFRKGYSTMGYIYVVSQVIEKSAEYVSPFRGI